jgi:hypothetical protein
MATSVTPIRSDSAPAIDERAFAAYLMGQAVNAAILLLNHDKSQQLAADVLNRARDRWDSVSPAQS